MSSTTSMTRSHLRLLWRRKWLLVLPVVAATVTAYLLAASEPPTWASHAEVLFDPGAMDRPIDVRTQTRIVTSPEVLARAADELGDGTTPDQLAGAITAEELDALPLLRIRARAHSADRAHDVVAAVLDAYLASRQDQVDQQRTTAMTEASRQVDALTTELEDVTRQLDGAARLGGPSDSEVAVLQARRELLTSQLAVQQGRLDELRTESVGALTDARVLVPPVLPGAPESPQPVRAGVLGLLIGLLIGFTLVLGREQLDDRAHSVDGVEEALVAPTLAVVPVRRRWRRRGRVALLHTPTAPEAEPYRILRAGLAAASVGTERRVVMVTSALAGEGKSTTAANLALAFAEAHMPVVLVDADLRRPTLHQLFDTDNRHGLRDALASPPDYSGLKILDTSTGRLGLLTAGRPDAGPAATLSSPQLARVLDRLKSDRVVIIDTPPMLPVADAAMLAGLADGIVVSVDPRVSDRRTLEQLRGRIASTGTPLLGTVVHASREVLADGRGYDYDYVREVKRPRRRAGHARRRRDRDTVRPR